MKLDVLLAVRTCFVCLRPRLVTGGGDMLDSTVDAHRIYVSFCCMRVLCVSLSWMDTLSLT